MSQDYIALEWVKGEIEETLQQAQQALEAYVETPEDKSRLKFCLSYLHQIHGTLQMVEFYGAALLAEEMEAVASALTAGSLASERQGLEILMQAIIQLPHYLEHVKVGRRDLPVVLLPILNELRSARGEALLSETALFAPTIRHNPPLTPAQANAIGSDDFGQWIRKVRQMLQTATLQLLQGKQVDVAKEYLARAFARLHKTLGHTPQGLVWLPALAFAEWLQKQQHLPNSARQLLRQLDALLKEAIEQGAVAINTPAPSELIKNLLFYVARTEVRTDAIRTVQEQFQLRQALPTEEEIQQERNALAGPDRATVGHVLGALVEEIAAIKDRFDLLVRSDDDRIATLSDLTANLKQLSDTLGMLGLGMPRKVMQDQQAAVNAMLETGNASDDALLEIAGALLYIEATLSGMQSEGDLTLGAQDSSLNDAQKAVLREARNVIEQVKDAVVAYIANQWAVHELESVPDLLRSVAGSMTMIPLPRVAAVMAQASAFVQNELIANEARPQWSVMDTFADALSSTEYYLERYSDNPSGASDELLTRAEQALAGVASGEAAVAVKAVEPKVAVEQRATENSKTPTIESAVVNRNADDFATGENLPTLEMGEFSEAEAGAEEEIVLHNDSADLLLDVIDHVDHSDSIDWSVENILPEIQVQAAAQNTETKAAPAAPVAAADDDLIDDEIIEIFIEEAGEVNETLDEYWPQFKANLDDNEALITVRRAFHTLKGSGRMVKAEFIGELAWSIENMFNRVLDSTIELSPELFALVDYVISQLPTLIDDFRLKQPASIDVEPLKAYAHALAAGEAVGPLADIIGQEAVVADAEVAPALESVHDIELMADIEVESAELDAAEIEFEPLADVDLQPVAVVEDNIPLDSKDEWSLAAALHVEDEDDDEDDALLEIFDGEARSHLQTVDEFVQLSRDEDYLNPLSDQVQRALHTLKGSAYMAGINCIAQVAAPLERLIKELRLYQIRNSRSVVEALAEGSRLISSALNDRTILASELIPGSKPYLETLAELEQELLADIDKTIEERRGPNPQAIARFMEQGMDSLLDADRLLNQWQQTNDRSILEQLQTDLQDVTGGAAEAELPHVQVLAEALNNFYQRACNHAATPNDGMLELAGKAHEVLLGMLDCLAAGQETEHPAALLLELERWSFDNAVAAPIEHDITFDDVVIADAAAANKVSAAVHNLAVGDTVTTDAELLPLNSDDEELLEIFLEEAQEISESVEAALLKWRDAPDDLLHVAQLQRELHTLKGGARMAEISAVADLCHELETLYENINDGRLGVQPELFNLLDRAHDELGAQLDQVRAGKLPQSATHMMQAIRQYLTGEIGGDILEVSDDVAEEFMPSAVTPALQTEALDESDREILEIFLEEANELQEALDSALHGWEQDPDDKAGPEEAQRVLHTLKGGARLSGLTRIGDLAHDFETDILHAQQGHIGRDAAFFKAAYKRQDELAHLIEEVAQALSGEALIALSEPSLTLEPEVVIDVPVLHDEIDVIEADSAADVADAEADNAAAETTAAANNVVPLRPVTKTPTPTTLDKAAATPQQQRATKAPQELVKVSADLLDNLVNLAGETSIGRGRLEQQVTDFAHTLDEMEMTLDRLRDQLRRLDMETEAQVLFRQERQGPDYEDFDPLEMDRYSTLQQLSRSLVESASDLFDLKETLAHKTRDAETLLLQQSRVNTELQEGLMKTRMVPFNRLVPRLRRIVRQVGQELGKQVELRVYNADGEMDRTILERMISPLEHMVRNAVDHGIENREQRTASGKSAVGYIDLDISRDGGDVLITMTDDGRGVNMAAVRKKAIERGLMAADDQLSDQEILQFILHAGFSTAETITQISGRGVGMDVVASEIKQMGGSVDIQSEAGVGTRFIVRLPFTVSVNRALMVKVGDDLYAVPLNNIQGIVRVPVGQMQALYEKPREERSYTYAGTDYRIEYLGVMLENEASPKFSAQSMPVPVLLVRGSTPFALQVDTLLGSREIVVKTLGPQFAGVRGVSGGTILGDGSVVIILDLPAMIRTQASLEYQHARALDHKEAERRHELENRLPRILVVDDSVTVRKVTSRLLERNGMEVFTAKDGVDAMATLQDHKPDLMLLDIEMPRMDGFEVASLVRHDSRLKDIPIIMITSRTGDKHRERAMSIGVNEYLGKPFQEDILLATMNRLLGRGDF